VRPPGTWEASLELGAAAAPATDAAGGILEGFAGMGTPQPGERNSGGGQTFVRDGESPEELARANRPVTPEEMERVRQEIGTGPNAYDERERKLREGMRRLREAQDAEATRPRTQTRAPMSHDLRDLYDDFNSTLARIRELEAERALPPNADFVDKIVNFFSTMNFSSYDELTHLRAMLEESKTRIGIYESQGADAVNEHDDVEKRKFMIQFGGEILNQGLGLAGGDAMHVAGQTMETMSGGRTELRPQNRPAAEPPVEPAAPQSETSPTRSRRNPDLNRGGEWQALSPDDAANARPGRMFDERERPRLPGEMAPSVQEGPTCAPTSIADAMRSQGREISAQDVIDAGHRAAAKDPTLTPPNEEGWMTRDTRRAAASELGFQADDASFQTVDQLKTLRDQGEVIVSVRTVRGGAHAMRVVSVDPAAPSVRNAANPADRTLGTVTLADTNPSRVPGQDGGRTVTISYEDFFQQTKSGASDTEGYAMTVRPQGGTQ
jgi:hypothetical protein